MSRLVASLVLAFVLLAATAGPVGADNCSGLSDCSTGVKIGLGVLAVVGIVGIGWAAVGAIGARAAIAIAAENAAARAASAAFSGAAAAIAPKVAPYLDSNKLHHIFGKASHNLGSLVGRYGSPEKAFAAIQNAANHIANSPAALSRTGVFQEVIRVGSEVVVVRGRVIDGMVRIGTVHRP